MKHLTDEQKEKLLDLNRSAPHMWDTDYILSVGETVLNAISDPDHKIWARVETVARSGMSRTISLFVIHTNKNGKQDILNLNMSPFVSVYSDRETADKNGNAYISGCGMDMLFEATYRLFHWFFPHGSDVPYQEHLNRYSWL